MSAADWQRFQELVLADRDLVHDLFSLTDGVAFVARCVAVAEQQSMVLDATDVEAAVRTGDRRWIEHWL